MKRNPHYQLKYISEVPYLVAFGQATADFGHDLRLNDTSLFLWNALESVISEEELVSLYMAEHNCPPEDYANIAESVHKFVAALRHQKLLLPEVYDVPESPCTTLKIAGLYLNLYGDRECFSDKLFEFETSIASTSPELTQNISILTSPPPYNRTGKIILRNRELYILENTNGYVLFFPASSYITEAYISHDGRNATILCRVSQCEECKQETFEVMQTLFLYFAGLHNMFALHSASVLYKEKAWLFSAASGVGKSTHTNLWREILKTPVLNGDLNLISRSNDTPVVHGIPWCGSSGISTPETHPIGGIILLKQGAADNCISLTDEQKFLYILHRNISPTWTADMQENILNIIEEIYPQILVCRFECTPKESAVRYIQSTIDNYLSTSNNYVRKCRLT